MRLAAVTYGRLADRQPNGPPGGAMKTCVICDTATTNTRQARIDGTTGPCCPDCAEWCDGNLIES